MPKFARMLLLVSLVLLVPVIPFVVLGWWLEPSLELWLRELSSPGPAAAVIIIALATDIFLPVPSSVVSTLAGQHLGVLWGAVSSWTGMTLGAVIGFAVARYWGRPLVRRLVSPEDLRSMDGLSRQLGPWVLVFTRALPVLAEATVLITGMHRLSWLWFFVPTAASNAGIATAYAALGDVSGSRGWLAPALGVSVALPLLLTFAARAVVTRRAGRK